MSAAAELFVRVSADIGDIKPKLAQVANEAGKMGAALGEAGKSVSSLGDVFKGTLAGNLAANGLQATASAAIEMGKSAISLAADLEESKIAFTTMLGSAQKADAFLRDLAAFAANTPFEMRGLQDAAKRLLAFGFESQAIIPIMNGVGNAVAAVGGGAAAIDGVTMALGQMAAKGKVSAEEMNQLAERGIPAWDMVAKKIGVSIPEAMKMAEKGAIPASAAIVGIVNGMNEKFGGMMAEQAKTLKGSWSNLSDGMAGVLTRLGTAFVKAFNITEIVSVAASALAGLAGTIDRVGLVGLLDRIFSPAVKAGILGIAAAVTGVLVPALSVAFVAAARTVAASVVAWGVAFWPVLASAAAIAAIAYPIMKNWDSLGQLMQKIWGLAEAKMLGWYTSARLVAQNFMKAFHAAAENVSAFFGRIFGGLAAHMGRMFATLPDEVRGPLEGLASSFKGFVVQAGGYVAQLPGVIGSHVGDATTSLVGSFQLEAAHLSNIMDSARGSVRGYMTGIFGDMKAAGREFGKAVTEDMLGLGKSAAKAADHAAGGAKRAGDGAKKAMAEAKKALVEAEKAAKAYAESIDRGEKEIEKFSRRVLVFSALGLEMRAVDAAAAKLGGRFDDNAAKAEALKTAISRLKSLGFAETSAAVRDLEARYKAAGEASEKLTGPIAASYKILDGATAKLDATRIKAKVLGEAFDENKAKTETYRDAIRSLVDEGFSYGNPAFEEAVGHLNALTLATPPATITIEGFREKMAGVSQATGSMRDGLATIASFFGTEFGGPILTAAGQVVDLGLALLQVVAAAPEVVNGITGVVTAINAALGPWGLVAAAVGVAIAAFVAFSKTQGDTGKASEAFTKRYKGMLVKTLNETDSWADKMAGLFEWVREKGQQAMRWYEDVTLGRTRKFLAKPVYDSVDDAANYVIDKFAEARKAVSDGFAGAFGGAIKAFLDGTKSMTQALRDGIRSAIIDGVTDALVKKAIIEQNLGPLMDKLAASFSEGANGSVMDPARIEKTVQAIGDRIPRLAAMMETVLKPLKASLDASFSPKQDQIAAILSARDKAIGDSSFKRSMLGSIDAAGYVGEKISATEKALTEMRAAGVTTTVAFADLARELEGFRAQLAGMKAAADAAKGAGKATTAADKAGDAIAAQYAPAIAAIQKQLTGYVNNGKRAGDADYDRAYANLRSLQAEMNVPALASGGLVGRATVAMVGEAGPEAVLPLNDAVYARIGQGIARNGGGAQGGDVHLHVNYTGSGKWTRQDAQEIGDLLITHLGRAGVRVR